MLYVNLHFVFLLFTGYNVLAQESKPSCGLPKTVEKTPTYSILGNSLDCGPSTDVISE